MIEATHRLARFKKLDLAVDAVAAEVEESSAALKDPALDGAVHLLRPVLRVGVENKDAVIVQLQQAAVKLEIGIKIVSVALPLQPAQ